MSEYKTGPSLAITDAVVVLPDRVIERGSVGLRQGRIAEISDSGVLQGSYDDEVDARGAYLVPGVIDLHNDSLETEINPRPESNLPLDFALATLERRLLAAGVTTEFHAIAFMNRSNSGRSVSNAAYRSAYLAEYAASGRQLIDNQVLHRIDVWSPEHLAAIFESVERLSMRYVSVNDHTPGQGQYRDLGAFKERMEAWVQQRGRVALNPDDALERMNTRNADKETVPMVYARIAEARQRLCFEIASHDDDSPEKVDTLQTLGARVSEFPVTIEAAQRARDLGMTIVVGAPNIVRGGSSSGNMDAQELFSLGLADVICADYHAPSMLPAAFRLVDEGVLDLPAAIRALSYNAASALQRFDLGAVRLGYVADLVLVRREGREFPQVERVFRSGRQMLSLPAVRREEVPA